MIKKKIGLILKIAISALLLFILFSEVGINEPLSLLKNVDLGILLIIFILSIIVLFIGSLNIKILANKLNKQIGIWRMFNYYTTSHSIGNLLPGKFGDLSILYFFKKDGLKIGESGAMYFIDKAISLALLLLASLIGMFIFIEPLGRGTIIFLFALFLILLIFLLGYRKIFIFAKRILGNYLQKFEGFQSTIELYLRHGKKEIFYNFVLTLVRLLLSALVILLAFKSIDPDIQIRFIHVITIYALTAIISLLPISLSGLGIRESIAVLLYSYLGISPQLSFSAYLLLLIFKVVFTALFILKYFIFAGHAKADSSFDLLTKHNPP